MTLTTLVDGKRETRELPDGTYMIGRQESCRIRFDFPEVSERHAILTLRDGKAVLEDIHSANGTYVNGIRIRPHVKTPIRPGDHIRLAAQEFIFQ